MNTPSIKWPMTAAAKQQALEKTLEKATSVAEVAAVVEASKAVKMPVHQTVHAAMHQGPKVKDGLTGKSRKRQEKKARRENSAWDEVNAISYACAQMIAVASHLTPMLAHRELLEQLDDIKLFNRLISSIVRDTRKLADDLQKIRALHSSKSGSVQNDGDLMDSYKVFTDYVNFMELANSCLVPSLAHASEMLSEALNKLHAINPALAAQINLDSMNYQFRQARQAMDGITGAGESHEERTAETAPAASQEEPVTA